jgi:hypothetical protein
MHVELTKKLVLADELVMIYEEDWFNDTRNVAA